MSTATGNIVSVEVLAQFFKKDVRTIQYWVSELGMPKIGRGEYDFIECCQWRIEYLDKEIEKLKLGDETLYRLEQEGAQLTNQMRKVKLWKELNSVVDRDLANIAWSNEITSLRSALDSLEYSLIMVLSNLYDEDKKKELIKKHIREIKNQLGTELRFNEPDEIIANDDEAG